MLRQEASSNRRSKPVRTSLSTFPPRKPGFPRRPQRNSRRRHDHLRLLSLSKQRGLHAQHSAWIACCMDCGPLVFHSSTRSPTATNGLEPRENGLEFHRTQASPRFTGWIRTDFRTGGACRSNASRAIASHASGIGSEVPVASCATR